MESYAWDDIYPELVNKLRWAICTSLKTPAANFPYGTGQTVATVMAQSIIDLVKTSVEEPGVLGSTQTVRGFFQQGIIAANLTR